MQYGQTSALTRLAIVVIFHGSPNAPNWSVFERYRAKLFLRVFEV